jgi:hypothetical protein
MVETPRLQAKNVFRCREATCHSGESRNPVNTMFGISGCRIESGMTAGTVRLKKQLILINPLKPFVLQTRVVYSAGIFSKSYPFVKGSFCCFRCNNIEHHNNPNDWKDTHWQRLKT